MNAAFLIVTSACLTGADPLPLLAPDAPRAAVTADKAPADKAAPEKIPAVPAPIASTSTCGSCGSCGCGYSHGWTESGGLFNRWKAGWSHSCDTCNTCNTCGHAPKVYAAPCTTCDSCCKPSWFERFKIHSCEPTCDSCGFFGHKSKGCGCDCGSAGVIVPATPSKPGEPVKVMPKEGEPKQLPKGDKEVNTPLTPELTPTTSKTIEIGTKSPF